MDRRHKHHLLASSNNPVWDSEGLVLRLLRKAVSMRHDSHRKDHRATHTLHKDRPSSSTTHLASSLDYHRMYRSKVRHQCLHRQRH